jgi:hypothetical protein
MAIIVGSYADFATRLLNSLEFQLKDAGEAVAANARGNVAAAGHIDTGKLVDSIRSETETESDTVTMRIIADAQNPRNEAYYGMFLERGTSKMMADPYEEPAVIEEMDTYDNMSQVIGKMVDNFINNNYQKIQ